MESQPLRQTHARAVCDDLVAYAEALTRHMPVPGGVIAIADGTRLLAHAAFGHANLERQTPVESDHRFEIGSISKVFTSLLVNQLVDENLLDLDEPISDVLSWLDLGAGDQPAAVTLRRLLNHTGGLVLGVDALTDDLDQAWILRNLSRAPAGQHFHYSNIGYVLLGLAAAARAHAPLPDLVHDRLLGPMGMTQTCACVTHDDRGTLATGYQPAADDRPWVPGDPLAPAPWLEVAAADGNIAATGPDMARLIMLLLGDGRIAGREVVTARAVDRIIQTVGPAGEPILNPPGVPRVESSRYGLGINVESIGGHQCLSHGGGMVGYSCFLLVDRTAGFGIAVLTNANGDAPAAQLICRVGHARLVTALTGATLERLPDPDPMVRCAIGDSSSGDGIPLGSFVTSRTPRDETLHIVPGGPAGAVLVERGRRTGHLFRTTGDGFVTDHHDLRLFQLHVAAVRGAQCWIHGADVYYPAGLVPWPEPDATAQLEPAPASWTCLVGHYRSYSPWYPNFRILRRGRRLLLVAPGGVEAPDDEQELVELSPGCFRIGSSDWYPERLIAGPVVDGRVVSVVRDGCRYSRTFTP